MRALKVGFRVLRGFGFRGLGFRVEGVGFRVLEVWGSGVWGNAGLGFQVGLWIVAKSSG